MPEEREHDRMVTRAQIEGDEVVIVPPRPGLVAGEHPAAVDEQRNAVVGADREEMPSAALKVQHARRVRQAILGTSFHRGRKVDGAVSRGREPPARARCGFGDGSVKARREMNLVRQALMIDRPGDEPGTEVPIRRRRKAVFARVRSRRFGVRAPQACASDNGRDQRA